MCVCARACVQMCACLCASVPIHTVCEMCVSMDAGCGSTSMYVLVHAVLPQHKCKDITYKITQYVCKVCVVVQLGLRLEPSCYPYSVTSRGGYP